MQHNYVNTEHLLLGLLHEQEGLAALVLRGLGLSLETVRSEVISLLEDTAQKKETPVPPTLEDRLATLENRLAILEQRYLVGRNKASTPGGTDASDPTR